MRRLTLHLFVAVLAFLAGVTAVTLLGQTFNRGERGRHHRRVHVERHFRHSPPARAYDCPLSRGLSELPPPPPPAELPDFTEPRLLPPEVFDPSKETRIRVRRADGTVQVIERRVEQAR